jgi:hypothetical protein
MGTREQALGGTRGQPEFSLPLVPSHPRLGRPSNSALKPPIIKRSSSVQLFPLQQYRVREPALAATFV